MQRILLTLFFLCAGMCYAFSGSCEMGSDLDKQYLSPEQIIVNEAGIFLLIDGEVISIQSIMQDDYGIYYLRPTIYWTCKKCGYGKNPAWTNYCKECKRRYNE